MSTEQHFESKELPQGCYERLLRILFGDRTTSDERPD